MNARRAFTLIELLIVIAIIAILSIVVVLVLNPVQLLMQSRDSNRVSDLATISTAISVYIGDQSSGNLGSSSVVYVSLVDPSATSTVGDQCQGLGLLVLPIAYTYHCSASSTFKNINATGWIPINFNQASFGSPIGSLPVDPINTVSSRDYYTYTTNGSQFELTAVMESAKYKPGGSNDVITGDGGTLATLYEKGTKLGLEPLDYGDSSLTGYWTFEEGTGTIAYDYSGNNATGSWSGTPSGANGYYSPGNIGGWAGAFDGASNYVVTGNTFSQANGTFVIWVDPSSFNRNGGLEASGASGVSLFFNTVNRIYYRTGTQFSTSTSQLAPGWHQFAMTWDGSLVSGYIDGQLQATGSQGTGLASRIYIGQVDSNTLYDYQGLLDDVRVYNRVLTATQIAALYVGGK